MTQTQTTTKNVKAHIACRSPFRASALSSQTFKRGDDPLAQYPNHRLSTENDRLLFRLSAKHDLYVIYSYNTPIVWIVDDGNVSDIYFNDDKYSVTTSKHMAAVRRALEV